MLIAGLWGSQQQALRQERNLVLLERLRAMADDGLPPPPPNEPWMEELAQLPAAGAPPAEVLKVPFNAAIANRAPTAPPPVPSSAGGSDGLPLLVGVVQVPGRSGSAIFQVGGTSTSAGVGESIGGSGWRLRSASGDTAVIERGGQVRRISISSGF
ncbi:MAG: DNA polymerase III subunit beta [Cyanobacteria bacterium M_surface_9_m1_291]|nr:DNA polymerase III subunit beta [Cyanobacteria bacterium M_surface_9_m1_291]